MTRLGLFEDLSDPLNGLFRRNQALLRAPEYHRGLSRDMDVTHRVGPTRGGPIGGSWDQIRLLCAFGGPPGPSEDL